MRPVALTEPFYSEMRRVLLCFTRLLGSRHTTAGVKLFTGCSFCAQTLGLQRLWNHKFHFWNSSAGYTVLHMEVPFPFQTRYFCLEMLNKVKSEMKYGSFMVTHAASSNPSSSSLSRASSAPKPPPVAPKVLCSSICLLILHNMTVQGEACHVRRGSFKKIMNKK